MRVMNFLLALIFYSGQPSMLKLKLVEVYLWLCLLLRRNAKLQFKMVFTLGAVTKHIYMPPNFARLGHAILGNFV